MLDEYREKVTRKQIPEALRFELMSEAGFCCSYCGGKDRLTIDHMVAKSKGGSDEKDNLRVACWPCNVGKRVAEDEGVRGGGFVGANKKGGI